MCQYVGRHTYADFSNRQYNLCKRNHGYEKLNRHRTVWKVCTSWKIKLCFLFYDFDVAKSKLRWKVFYNSEIVNNNIDSDKKYIESLSIRIKSENI